ncbi:hypothetical protein [Agathobacter sp.]
MFRRKNMNCHGVPLSIECGDKTVAKHNLSRIRSVADFIFFSEEDTVCHAGYKNLHSRKFSDFKERNFACPSKVIAETSDKYVKKANFKHISRKK